MRETVSLTGMVLKATPSGESDRRLVILTKERGKITAFARGARKSKSPLLAAANPFVFGSFQVYEGRTAYTLAQASVKNYFTELANRQPGVYYGFYFLEIADYYGREGARETDMLNLLYITMRALLNDRIPNRLIRSIFELKALVLSGEYPQTFECVCCGSRERLSHFSLYRSGCVCPSCVPQVKDARPISPSALYTLQYIIASPMEKLYTFTVSPEVEEEVGRLVTHYMELHTDRKFKSLEILKVMDS